jgi:hypothetical protein
MKLRVSCLSILASLAAWLPARGADEPIDFLPEETSVYFSFSKTKDTPALADHPIYKALATPAMKKAFAPLLAQMAEGEERAAKVWKEETGLTLEQAEALMAGTTAFGLRAQFDQIVDKIAENRGKGADVESPFTMMDMIGAVHFAGDEALAEKVVNAYLRIFKEGNASAAAKNPDVSKFPEFEATTEDHEGVKLHIYKPKGGEKAILRDAGWAFMDKMIVFASSEKALAGAVDLAKKGGPSLAKAPRFAPIAEKSKNGNFTFFVDLHATIGAMVKKFVALQGNAVQEGAPNPATVLAALGVDKFDSVSLLGDFKGGAVTAELGVNYHDKPGLMSLMAVDGPGTVPDFLPPYATSGAYGTFVLERMMTAAEQVLKEAYPPFSAAMAVQLDEVKQKTGVDIKKDLLANLGPDMWSVTGELATPGKLSEKKGDDEDEDLATEPQVFGLRVKDKKAFQLALKSLLNYVAPDQALFEDREYRGNTIRSMKGLPMPVSYVLTDDWLIVNLGPEILLEDVLGRLKSPGGEHLFGQAHIRDAFKAFPAGDSGTSYLNFGDLLQTIVTLLRQLPEVEALDSIVDLKALPEKLNLSLSLFSKSYLEDNGYRVHFRLEEKSK